MKKIILTILSINIILLGNIVFANNIEYNTEGNIQKAQLVEKYVQNHKDKINNFLKKYKLNNNIFENDIKKLNESIIALQKIQNTQVEKQKAENIMKTVIKRIKLINSNLKIKLKEAKNNFILKLQKKKSIYSRLGIKLSDKIDNINIKIARKIFKNKKNLSEKEKELKLSLIKLNKESQKLRNFNQINFNSEKEIKDSFIRILKNIKREIQYMKKILN